jgi:hypothetical protein
MTMTSKAERNRTGREKEKEVVNEDQHSTAL